MLLRRRIFACLKLNTTHVSSETYFCCFSGLGAPTPVTRQRLSLSPSPPQSVNGIKAIRKMYREREKVKHADYGIVVRCSRFAQMLLVLSQTPKPNARRPVRVMAATATDDGTHNRRVPLLKQRREKYFSWYSAAMP